MGFLKWLWELFLKRKEYRESRRYYFMEVFVMMCLLSPLAFLGQYAFLHHDLFYTEPYKTLLIPGLVVVGMYAAMVRKLTRFIVRFIMGKPPGTYGVFGAEAVI